MVHRPAASVRSAPAADPSGEGRRERAGAEAFGASAPSFFSELDPPPFRGDRNTESAILKSLSDLNASVKRVEETLRSLKEPLVDSLDGRLVSIIDLLGNLSQQFAEPSEGLSGRGLERPARSMADPEILPVEHFVSKFARGDFIKEPLPPIEYP